MKVVNKFLYLLLLISTYSFSQTKQNSNKDNFTKQFFLNNKVGLVLKKYSNDNKIIILDTQKLLTENKLIFDNKDLKITILPEKKENYDFLLKKVIINENLAFVVIWNKDNITALSFYPFLSEFTHDKWIVEEITTRNIK